MLIWKNSSIETAVMSTSVTPATGFASHNALRNVAPPRQELLLFLHNSISTIKSKNQSIFVIAPAGCRRNKGFKNVCAPSAHFLSPISFIGIGDWPGAWLLPMALSTLGAIKEVNGTIL